MSISHDPAGCSYSQPLPLLVSRDSIDAPERSPTRASFPEVQEINGGGLRRPRIKDGEVAG